MKTISLSKLSILSMFFLAGSQLSASTTLFSDDFRGTGPGLDSNHWNVIGQNVTGWATIGNGYLEINGGPVSPNNNSQGWFAQGKDDWDLSSGSYTVSLTFLPPNVTTQSATGIQSLSSWLWISEGTPTGSSSSLSTNNHFLLWVGQGIGGADYNKVEIYKKNTGGTGMGTLLWGGRYSITGDPYPSLSVTITIDEENYSVVLDQEMTNTTGSLTGQHGITFTESIYSNLGGSNGGLGRGETRFQDFSIVVIPEASNATFLMVLCIGSAVAIRYSHRKLKR